jgi:predicted ATP-grasp superfamily ATP-dependent carboligase
LIEINPRTWLWVGLAKECGVDYAKIMYNYSQRIDQVYPTTYKQGIKWKNYITDFVYSFIALLKKQVRFSEYLKSLKGESVPAIWSIKDIRPGLIFPFMLFYIAKKRG